MTFEDLMKVVDDIQPVMLVVHGDTVVGTACALNTYICVETANAEVVGVVVVDGMMKCATEDCPCAEIVVWTTALVTHALITATGNGAEQRRIDHEHNSHTPITPNPLRFSAPLHMRRNTRTGNPYSIAWQDLRRRI